MDVTSNLQILELREAYRDWACRVLEREWGATIVVSRGRAHEAADLPGFVAIRGDRPVGLSTYRIEDESCELMTMNSLQPRLGVGSALVAAVRAAAIDAGCRRLWLITTNDNMPALRFYQQRGFSLSALHKNAVEQSRILKPEIPANGFSNIPIRDEIELEMNLAPSNDEPAISSVHHAQIMIPKGEEAAGREFYCQILGFSEIDKPDALKDRGGFWFLAGDNPIHVGTENSFDRYSTKAHLAYLVSDLDLWRDRLEALGVVFEKSIKLPGYNRFQFRDPFGNRVEFLEATSPE
jgi:catechol 2,3-dioxygenase-like lactoylglutathione lyase family enzyme/ribosomal protein S18 acetylase RimI-like enzyme